MSRVTFGVVSAVLSLCICFFSPTAEAGYCWGWSTFNATDPESWNCGVCDDGVCPGDVLGQNIRHEHRNWHCSNSVVFDEPYGRKFLAFHRQFILDFDNWRLANTTLGRFEPWDPYQNAAVPGDNESTSAAFTHCSTASCTSQPCYCSENNTTPCNDNGDCSGTCEDIRPAGTLCPSCQDLPAAFIGTNLNNFSSLG